MLDKDRVNAAHKASPKLAGPFASAPWFGFAASFCLSCSSLETSVVQSLRMLVAVRVSRSQQSQPKGATGENVLSATLESSQRRLGRAPVRVAVHPEMPFSGADLKRHDGRMLVVWSTNTAAD